MLISQAVSVLSNTVMLAIKNKYTIGKSQDTEMLHIKFDEYICEVLKSYGFHKGVEVFKDTELWYS